LNRIVDHNLRLIPIAVCRAIGDAPILVIAEDHLLK
jgi:hypothetical protein